MKNKLLSVFAAVLCTLAILPISNNVQAGAQTSDIIREAGDITGTVTYCGLGAQDIEVYIPGTSYSSTTDSNGIFRLSYVQQGTYDLVVKNNALKLGTIPQVVVVKKQLVATGVNNFCVDLDGDGFNPPLDCNDNNPSVNPGAIEICGDGIDNNCNVTVDEGCQVCTDNDQDGFFAQSGCGTEIDCNDSNPAINPQATEVCDNIDNNCSNTIDESGAVGETTYYQDADQDGYGDSSIAVQSCGVPTGYVSNSGDCDDGDDSINPGATEVNDGIDNNCNGLVDDGITPPGSQVFSSSGYFTVPEGITQINVVLWGAGGGGGGSTGISLTCLTGAGGGGGSSGGYIAGNLTVSPGQQIDVEIGGGGPGGQGSGNNGYHGGDTIFSWLTAVGGNGGQGAVGCTPGAGGYGAAQNHYNPDDLVMDGVTGESGSGCTGGSGGVRDYGSGGKGGKGGDGCSGSSQPGQAGQRGRAIISWQ